jgi:hypothetical protein
MLRVLKELDKLTVTIDMSLKPGARAAVMSNAVVGMLL